MRKFLTSVGIAILIAVFGVGVFGQHQAWAEDESNEGKIITGLTISPASQTLQLSSETVYTGTLSVTNDGTSEIAVQVYAAPYSYVYSEEEDTYKLGYSNQTTFTQLSRWITVKNESGRYETKPTFTLAPNETKEVEYRVTTPENIPAGGQYAVLFAQVKSTSSATGSVKADPGLGMIIYGHSTEGEIISTSEIKDMKFGEGTKETEAGDKKTVFYASAKVKNTGNVDFFAEGKLKISPIIGFSSYETASGRMTSIIPETELTITDEWDELPSFGIYQATWTIVTNDKTETISQTIFRISPIAIIIFIIVLTIIIVSIIMMIKRRKARRSRLAI